MHYLVERRVVVVVVVVVVAVHAEASSSSSSHACACVETLDAANRGQTVVVLRVDGRRLVLVAVKVQLAPLVVHTNAQLQLVSGPEHRVRGRRLGRGLDATGKRECVQVLSSLGVDGRENLIVAAQSLIVGVVRCPGVAVVVLSHLAVAVLAGTPVVNLWLAVLAVGDVKVGLGLAIRWLDVHVARCFHLLDQIRCVRDELLRHHCGTRHIHSVLEAGAHRVVVELALTDSHVSHHLRGHKRVPECIHACVPPG